MERIRMLGAGVNSWRKVLSGDEERDEAGHLLQRSP